MSQEEETYECMSCHRTATVEHTKEPLMCCGKPMQKVSRDICLQPAHAEHARPMEPEDACDEFRSGE
jgi:hypothetical protein